MTEQLYGTAEVATAIGASRTWVQDHSRKPAAPKADFEYVNQGGQRTLLWTERSIGLWARYFRLLRGKKRSGPRLVRTINFSDHWTVNTVGSATVTWKLWWRNLWDGRTQWWFSTPNGWYTSDNDGTTWEATGLTERPGDTSYYFVPSNSEASGLTAQILDSAARLRRSLIESSVSA